MATSLSSNFQLGDTGVSSLVKSAASLENQISTYNDDEAAITYENSDKTDADFQTYEQYLSGRVTQLSGTGSVTDQTKALTLSQKIISAQKSNISANVQRDSIAVLDGSGTLQDKYNDIVSGYQQLQSIGDESGAQSLMSTAYSLSQTIQLNAQTAATAAQTAASTFAANQVSSMDQYESKVSDTIKNLVTKIGVNGMEAASKTFQQYDINNHINLPKGTQATLWDLVTSMIGTTKDMTSSDLSNIVSTAVNAGQSPNSPLLTLQFNPGSLLSTQQSILKTLTPGTSQYNTVMNDMIGYLSGTKTLPAEVTNADGSTKSMTLYDALNAQQGAANGQPVVETEIKDGQTVFTATKTTGWTYGKNQAGEYVPIETTGSMGATLSTAQKTMLEKSGFQIISNSAGNTMVQATQADGNPTKLINGIKGLQGQGSSPIQVFAGKNNTFTFSVGGQIYNLAVDNGSKVGIFQVNTPNAKGQVSTKMISSEGGFNVKDTMPGQSIEKDIVGYLHDSGAILSTSATGISSLVGVGESKTSQNIAAQNAKETAMRIQVAHQNTFSMNNGLSNVTALANATSTAVAAAAKVVPPVLNSMLNDPGDLLNTISTAAENIGKSAAKDVEGAAKDVGNVVEQGAKDVGSAVSGAAHAIGSIL